MALDTNLRGSTSGNGAEVDASNRLLVKMSDATTPADVGALRIFSENDAGDFTGSPTLLSPETSQDFRLRVGIDTVLMCDTFNASAQNTNNWSYTFNTLTASQPGAGTVNFGTVQGTTSAHGAFMRSFSYFPLIGTAPLAVEFTFGAFVSALVAGEVWMCGVGLPSAATTEATDGVWLRFTSAGLIGEIRYNNVTTQSGVLRLANQLNLGELYKVAIVIGESSVEYWMDEVLLGSSVIPASNGQPFQSAALPVFMHKYNTGAVSNTNTMRVSDVTVSLMDVASNKPWAHQLCSAGLSTAQGQNGGTMGTTALLPNATAATTVTGAALSQTVAIATGLGGQAGIIAAVAGIDGIITAFQNPTGGINQSPRNLIITGVRISSVNLGAAVATTASILQWSLAFGATGGTIPSLAQAETASFATATAKAHRRLPLGIQSYVVGAAIGAQAPEISVNFESPIVINPGQWVCTAAKFLVGTATASQVIWSTVMLNGYYE
jgi:hypothetical protein